MNHCVSIFVRTLAVCIICGLLSSLTFAKPPSKPDNPGIPGLIYELEETIKTLELMVEQLELENQELRTDLDNQVPAAVSQTGQKNCYDADATIPCAGTGQDGEYQLGASVSPRFTDNGDGTVSDNLTGLIWLRNANCKDIVSNIDNLPITTWSNALVAANSLAAGDCDLTDGSWPGNWRLPNVKELQSLMDYALSETALPMDNPFEGLEILFFWSSTTVTIDTAVRNEAWGINLLQGGSFRALKNSAQLAVWPVRGVLEE